MRRSWRALAGRAEFEGWAEGQLAEARRGGTFKTERVLASPQRARVAVLDPGAPHHASMLNFCANNYLGLANHPALVLLFLSFFLFFSLLPSSSSLSSSSSLFLLPSSSSSLFFCFCSLLAGVRCPARAGRARLWHGLRPLHLR
jgi:hypothetical protein